ncbi:MAG: DUF3137 domain-containing protein [Thermotaleaceae bacterium]
MKSENFEQPSNSELETKLYELKTKKKRMGLIALLCLIAVIVFLLMAEVILFIFALLGVIVFGMKSMGANREIKQIVKINTVEEVIKEVFDDCIYNPYGSVDRTRIRDSGLIDDWDSGGDSYDTETHFKFVGNDYISGKYKGHQIELCDVNVTKITKKIEVDEEGKREEREEQENSFKGIWMTCKLEKFLPAEVRIREKKERALLFKNIVGKYTWVKSDVETENHAFNEQFQILTNDVHYTFYVLTPHFMERILSVDKKSGGQTLLCFRGEWVHIAVHSGKDFFEIKKGSEIKDIQALRLRIQNEITYFTDILDELFHNEQLFS